MHPGQAGQRSEGEIGLYFYVARFYDPALGRFIQQDSIIPDPISAQAWDRYAYSLNSPINYSDPSGHDAIGDVWNTAGAGATAAGAAILAVVGAPVVLAIAAVAVVSVGVVYAYEFGPNASSNRAEMAKFQEYYSTTVANSTSLADQLALAKGDGGAKSSAEHLSMLMDGVDVGGFGPHPGAPDPYGRDRKHNVEGFRNTLRDIQENMRKGESLPDYLSRQGWTERQITSYINYVQQYISDVLPTDIEFNGVSQELADEVMSLVKSLGIK